ncbi:MAG: polysaccharide biosynthesis C-terminal domain-containing protein [Bacteroidetes bacterium]|nr:polysaccharide biosynthesis C-terminal domain-containing protein [Bacteroidota bacterium]
MIEKLKSYTVSKEKAKSIIGIALIQAFSIILVFLSSKILIDNFGNNNFGLYNYANAIITLVGILIVAGFTSLLLKQIPIYVAAKNNNLLSALLNWCNRHVLVYTLASTLVCFSFLLFSKNDFSIVDIFLIIICIPIHAFIQLKQTSLNALKQHKKSQIAEKVIKPLLLIIPTLILIPFLHLPNNTTLLLSINLLAFAGTLVLVHLFKRNKISNATAPKEEEQKWQSSLKKLSVVGLLSIIASKIDILLQSNLSTNESVAIYSIALRISEFVSFPLLIATIFILPNISSLYEQQKKIELEKLLKQSSKLTTIGALVFISILILAGKSILLFFNETISTGYTPLLVMSLGQLINVCCGSVGYLLLLTGKESLAIKAAIISLLIQVATIIILTPIYNELGTAIATSTSTICWNMLMLYYCIKHLKINPSIFPIHVKKA